MTAPDMIEISTKGLPEGWFLYHVGELVKPIRYKDDKHEHIGWRVEFQHRDGGLLTYAEHPDLEEAVDEAIKKVQEIHAEYKANPEAENDTGLATFGDTMS